MFTQNEYHQIHLETKIPLNRRDHISVMGDYVVTTRIPSTTAKSIDLLYNTVSDEEIIKIKLSALLNKPVKITLTIEKSKQKADKLRGMFKKYFFFFFKKAHRWGAFEWVELLYFYKRKNFSFNQNIVSSGWKIHNIENFSIFNFICHQIYFLW